MLEKRTEKKLAEGKEPPQLKRRQNDMAQSEDRPKKKQKSKPKAEEHSSAQLSSVLGSIF